MAKLSHDSYIEVFTLEEKADIVKHYKNTHGTLCSQSRQLQFLFGWKIKKTLWRNKSEDKVKKI